MKNYIATFAVIAVIVLASCQKSTTKATETETITDSTCCQVDSTKTTVDSTKVTVDTTKTK